MRWLALGCLVAVAGACARNDVVREETVLHRRLELRRLPPTTELRVVTAREGESVVVTAQAVQACGEERREVTRVAVVERRSPETGVLVAEWWALGAGLVGALALGLQCPDAECEGDAAVARTAGGALFFLMALPAAVALAVDYDQASETVREEDRAAAPVARTVECGVHAARDLAVTWVGVAGNRLEARTDADGRARLPGVLVAGGGDVLLEGRLVGHVEPGPEAP